MTTWRVRDSTLSRSCGAVLVAVLIMAPALVKLISYPAYPGPDDAFIHIAVAEHILRGEGWGIADYDRVNLSSSPAFTLLLLPVFAIGSIGLAQALSLVFACAATAVTFFGTRVITASNTCGFAALVIATSNVHLWRWSGTVMETSLAYLVVTVIAVATIRLIQTRRYSVRSLVLLGALVGFGAIVRFEIAVFLPLSIIALWIPWRANGRQIAAVVVGFIVAALPWIVFATVYFGTPIPTTFFAKTNGIHLVNGAAMKAIGGVVVTGSGVSLLIAAVAIALAGRSSKGRERLRDLAIPLLFLVGWPTGLFAFYYIKMDAAMISARYVLVGMATWPLAVGLMVSDVSRKRPYRLWLAAALVGCLIAGLVINTIVVRPVLTAFNGGYRAVMADGARYMRDHCQPGDSALIDFDIGIMAVEGIGNCSLVDLGALATPELRGLTLAETLSRIKPTYLVETTGRSRNELAAEYPQLSLRMSAGYTNRGVVNAGQEYLNIYRVTT